MFDRVSRKMQARSALLLTSLEGRLDRILQLWLLLAGLACAVRLVTAPVTTGGATFGTVAPYLLVIVAPFASTLLALRWFREGDRLPQPTIRLAVLGRWRTVSAAEARAHRLYGTGGIMVSLLIGMMLNVPLRTAEFLAAIPPVPAVTPAWLSALHLAMTFDVVLFSSLYMIAFVAALRRVPLFPRLLLAIWLCDITMQLLIANYVMGAGQVPGPVAGALESLLMGNVKKVLISAALWLPYLLLSERVNVTYRRRIAA